AYPGGCTGARPPRPARSRTCRVAGCDLVTPCTPVLRVRNLPLRKIFFACGGHMHTNESRRPDRPDHPRRRTGRALVRLAAAAGVLGLLGAGCGDAEPTSSGQGNQLGSDQQVADVIKPASGEPRKGGNLRVGLDAETTEGWDPTDSRFAGAGITIA